MQIQGALASKMAHHARKSLSFACQSATLFIMVRVEGLEPPRLTAVEPKSTASTNSAIPALTAARSSPQGPGPQEAASISPVMKIATEKSISPTALLIGVPERHPYISGVQPHAL